MGKKTTAHQQPDDYYHVCILLIFHENKVLVEPYFSNKTGAKVVRALSYKFENEIDVKTALEKLAVKYKLSLSSLYPHEKKIDRMKFFEIDGKKFHVFAIEHNKKRKIQVNGNFCFIHKDELVNQNTVAVKGNGKCIINESLKMALN